MAVIGKIREKSGLLLVIIGLALAAFVLGDLFQNLGKGSNFDQTRLALINDEKVSTQDFSSRVSEQSELMMQQLQKNNLTPEESYRNVMSAWSIVKRETILRQQMLELGLVQATEKQSTPGISMDEYMDRLTGKNPHAEISRNFGDPNTGEFNPEAVENFLNYVEQGIHSEDAQQREQAFVSKKQWNQLSEYIKNDVLETKYNNLIAKAYYLPTALAEADFIENNQTKTVVYFGARYNLVADEEVNATDADFEAFYQEHKHEYESEKETRMIEYVQWVVRPSQKDMQDLNVQIAEYAQELASAEKRNIPYLVNRSGDSRYDSSWVKAGTLSPFIDSAAFAAEIGTVLGPWSENSAYHVARIMDRQIRPDSMKASHILISFKGAPAAQEATTRSKEEARILADSIQIAIAADADAFDRLVSRSDDPSAAENNGSLDWFVDGAMIPEFNQACIDGNKGDLVVVETTYGFHVLRIEDKTEALEKVRIAQIDLPIEYSSETFEMAFNEANKFAALNRDYEAFDTASENQGLNIIKGNFIDEMGSGIRGLNNSRKLVKWMFEEEVTVGTVSNVFDFDDKIIVAILTDIKPEGTLPLEAVKEDIRVLVERDVKARILSERMTNVTDIAQASEFSAAVDTANVAFATYSLPKYGPEQNVLARISTSETGKLVGPIKGDQGVFFFQVLESTEAPAEKDLDYTQQRDADRFAQRVSTSAYRALEESAEIEDFLYFFY